MELYEGLAKVTIIMTCVSICTGFVLVKSEKNEDDKSIETRIVYLINLLEKLKDITEPDYSNDDVTSYNQFDKDITEPDYDSDDVTSYNQFAGDSTSGREDDKSIETKVVYLIYLLEKLKDITEPDYDSDDVTSYNQFDDDSIPERDDVPHGRIQQVDDTHTRMIDIHKKDFAILPSANELCRVMGFRRCRQSHI